MYNIYLQFYTSVYSRLYDLSQSDQLYSVQMNPGRLFDLFSSSKIGLFFTFFNYWEKNWSENQSVCYGEKYLQHHLEIFMWALILGLMYFFNVNLSLREAVIRDKKRFLVKSFHKMVTLFIYFFVHFFYEKKRWFWRLFEGCFKGVWRVLQGVWRVFEGCLEK